MLYRRRLFATEVIQTSGMDCGPAALKCLLDGFGIPVSYGRLREACHTDIDGSSIDTLEEVACELGLAAEQIILPVDHVLRSEARALPAVVVVRNPDGIMHFVVAWRRCGPFVQVMDPARGRLWVQVPHFVKWMAVHATSVPTGAWRAWAGTDAFLQPLDRRLRAIGLSPLEARSMVADAISDPTWRGLGTLDAGARLVASLRSAGAVKRRHASRVLSGLLIDSDAHASPIPDAFWSVRPVHDSSAGRDHLRIRGVVLVRAGGRRTGKAATSVGAPLTAHRPGVSAALAGADPHPWREVLRALWADGLLAPAILAITVLVAVAGVIFEALLFRSLLDVSTWLRLPEQRWGAAGFLAGFAGLLLGVQTLLSAVELRAGRVLEGRLRIGFLKKIPRLADAYFQTRPVSDMMERSHSLHTVRQLPALGTRFLRVALELVVTTAALIWLNPEVASIAAIAALAATAIPLFAQPAIAERDLRVRTHVGALARYQLDAASGRTAVDAHGASILIEREHERLLREWIQASLALQRTVVSVEALQMVVGLGLAGWMVFSQLSGDIGGLILLQLYWALNLPALGYELALHVREYPVQRSTLLRLLEPMGAPEDPLVETPELSAKQRQGLEPAGMCIEARHVSVTLGGHTVLRDIDLVIEPGTHVAVVGPSGAGKSTLAGLILGWHRPAEGDVIVDGRVIGTILGEVRRHTAWVDPTVRIWNASLLDNLLYGSGIAGAIGPVMEATGLMPLLAKLPEGLNTSLGDNGALLSAGEAQRVRLARAMLRPETRLALLDEPFLGLEGDRRRTLLAHVRRHWEHSTLLYITHDVLETRQFDRIIVMEAGRIVEDGSPQMLWHRPSSRYRDLLQAQERVADLWSSGGEWQRLEMDSGRIKHEEVQASERTTKPGYLATYQRHLANQSRW
jgi:ATP-binding cassette subfamily B protein